MDTMKTTIICQHPAKSTDTPITLPRVVLLLVCPDCGAECSRHSIGDDDLCYDDRCPLHADEALRGDGR